MSVKAMSLVWELECPKMWNEMEFQPEDKFILLAYADNADHYGKNIYPALQTVAKKTGFSRSTVKRRTHKLRDLGYLIADGIARFGTSRWMLPFGEVGVNLTPGQIDPGSKTRFPSGVNPSGVNPSGVNLTPELNEPEPDQIININNMGLIWKQTKEKIRATITERQFETWLEVTHPNRIEDRTLIINTINTYAAAWLTQRIRAQAENILGYYVQFEVGEFIDETE